MKNINIENLSSYNKEELIEIILQKDNEIKRIIHISNGGGFCIECDEEIEDNVDYCEKCVKMKNDEELNDLGKICDTCGRDFLQFFVYDKIFR